MTVSNTQQILEFIYSFCCGIGLGVLYTTLDRIRKMRILMDILFSVSAIAAAVIFFLTVCNGLVRSYQIAGMITGIVAVQFIYRRFLSRDHNGKKQRKTKKT